MDAFDPKDLTDLYDRTKSIESDLVKLIEKEVPIERYLSVEDFIREN